MPRDIRRTTDLSHLRAGNNNSNHSGGDCNANVNPNADRNPNGDRNPNSKSGCDRNGRLRDIRIPVPGYTLSVAQPLPPVVTTAERYRQQRYGLQPNTDRRTDDE